MRRPLFKPPLRLLALYLTLSLSATTQGLFRNAGSDHKPMLKEMFVQHYESFFSVRLAASTPPITVSPPSA